MIPILFNDGWSYEASQGGLVYLLGRSRGAQFGSQPVAVTLPHDATIHEKRSPGDRTAMNRGGFPHGTYIYSKKFHVPEDWAEKRVMLEFEGVYMNAMVYLNGEFVGQCPNGYAGFTIACNPRLLYGVENELRVHCSCDQDSRWYAGAGIYRDVQLYVAEPLHIAHNGVKFTTVSADAQVAAVQAAVTVENEGLTNRDVQLRIRFFDADGKLAAEDIHPLHITGGTVQTVEPRIYLRNPRLWNLDAPHCYRVELELLEGEEAVDTAVVETFGIRVLTLDNVRGLAINGQTVKLNGGCIHHDNGIVGSATFAAAEERRVRRLKAAGYNAIRMAHHPASRHLLRACDRCGLAVMDELTDIWTNPKNYRDYGHMIHYRWEEDVRDMVEKDYNHPSVILYSTGNEIPESARPEGVETYRMLRRLIRQLDSSRYITAGHNSMLGDLDAGNRAMADLQKQASDDINETMAGLGMDQSKIMCHPYTQKANREALETMDIAGYNYSTDRYRADAACYTNWISVGAETYPREIGYNWPIVLEEPGVVGDFVWAAWDYMGEAGIGGPRYRHGAQVGFGGEYPWFAAASTDFDLTGVEKPQGYYREIVVGHRTEPYIAVQDPAHYAEEPYITGWSWTTDVSSWNWDGQEGKPVRVEVYARAEEAELWINGRSLGRQPIPQETKEDCFACRAVFDVVYEPGQIETVVYTGGVETGRYAVETAMEEVELELRAESRGDLCFVEISLRDSQGRLNPGAVRRVHLELTGSAVLQGLGSGNPCTEENFFDDCCTTYHGQALAAIRPTGAGEITVVATAEGCKPAKLTIAE